MNEVVSSHKVTTKSFTVFIEGNIGSGKSTFLRLCENHEFIHVIQEPVDEWTSVGGVNLLDNFYKDPIAHGFTLQSYITLSMLKNHLLVNGKPVKIMERSLYSARNCFVKYMRNNGGLDPGQYAVLQKWYDFFDENHTISPDLIVYLRTSPATAYQRLQRRGRAEETAVSSAYLNRLHDLHEEWLGHEKEVDRVPVLTIDADRPIHELEAEYTACIANILLMAKG